MKGSLYGCILLQPRLSTVCVYIYSSGFGSDSRALVLWMGCLQPQCMFLPLEVNPTLCTVDLMVWLQTTLHVSFLFFTLFEPSVEEESCSLYRSQWVGAMQSSFFSVPWLHLGLLVPIALPIRLTYFSFDLFTSPARDLREDDNYPKSSVVLVHVLL